MRIAFAACLALGLCAAAQAAPAPAPTGAWRTTNECFLAAFIVLEGGRARALYISGETDDKAAWTWDGATLTITTPAFPMDSFAGRLANDRVEADYVWHDLDKDQLNKQVCVFEKFTPLGLF